MKIEEFLARESIRKTMASYTLAGDRLRPDDFVAVFTEDGILESENVAPADSFRYEGRTALRDWFARWRAGSASPSSGPSATFIRHHLSTSQIDITSADTANARTYWVAYTDIGPDHCGYYVDVFRKVGEEWLIAHRRVRMDWRAPNSLFTTAIERSR